MAATLAERITIIGGGAVGLCTAFELSQAGREVTLVERDRCGEATSRGNAGWIIPATTTPVGTPAVRRDALKWLLRQNSPARIGLRLDPEFIRWCLRFWRDSGPRRYRAILAAMLAFNRPTLELYDRLHETPGVSFEMRKGKFLIAALTRHELDHDREELDTLAEMGFPEYTEQSHYDAAQARALDPALSDAVAGAIALPASRQVRPDTLCSGLRNYLEADTRVTLREDTAVDRLEPHGTGWRLRTTGGDIESDRVIVAAGLWSRALMLPLGIRLPLQGARGVSITARGSGERPRHSLKLAEAQVACHSFDTETRLSGTWDLVGNNAEFDPRRLQAVIRAARPYLRDWKPDNPSLEWAGLRPSTPDSLPIIGPVPARKGLYLATGHGMFGVTYAPATALALKRLIVDGVTPPEIAPFDVQRFG